MRLYLLFIIFLICVSNSFGQSNFIKVFSDVDATKPFSGRHIVETTDHNYSFLCTNNLFPVVVRLDANGNEFNRFEIQRHRLGPVCLAVDDRYEYYFCGRDSTLYTGYLEQTDSNGVIHLHRGEYGAVGYSEAHGVYRTTGNEIVYNFWANSEMCHNPEYFLHIDSLGNNFINESSYNLLNPSKQSFQFLGNRRMCTIAPEIAGCNDTIQFYSSNLRVFDTSYVQTSYNFGELYNTIDTTFGGGFILGSVNEISRMDTATGIAWTQALPSTMSYQIALRQLADSSFILVGDQYITGLGQQLVIYKYDWNGNLLWSQNYGGPANEYFSNLLLTDDNGFLISGTTFSYGPGSKAIIVKTDSLGNTSNLPLIVSSANSICSGDSTSLSLPGGYSYLWSTGQTTQSIYATTANSYSAVLTSSGGVQFFSDTISLNVIATTKPNLGNDTLLCAGSRLVLNVGSGYTMYRWSNGSFANTDTVSVGGNYIVEAIDANSCSTYDTIQVSFVSLPPFDLGPDIFQCDTTPVVLHSPGILQWTWSNGSTDTTLAVDTSGVYSIVFTNGVCADTNYIGIHIHPAAFVNLINDTTICTQQILLLDAGSGFLSYLWQDGSTQSTFNAHSSVPATILYSVSVLDSNGCPAYDDVVVDFQICISTEDRSPENEFTIYPNPVSASQSIFIDSKNLKPVAIEIVSVSGEMILKKDEELLPATIRLKDLAPGVYFIKIIDLENGRQSNTKLLVKS